MNSFVLTADFADYADDWATKAQSTQMTEDRLVISDLRPPTSDLNEIRYTNDETRVIGGDAVLSSVEGSRR